MIRVNCGAIPPELVDSELFGHERGSFTGATAHAPRLVRARRRRHALPRRGRRAAARGAGAPAARAAGRHARARRRRPARCTVDVRVVAATHRDLRAMCAGGAFREDLWYRISVFSVRHPAAARAHAGHPGARRALRAPRGRAPHRRPARRRRRTTSPRCSRYAWPGNVRELAAVIERAAILGERPAARGRARRSATERAIGVRRRSTDAEPSSSPSARDASFPTLDDAVRAHIERALVAHVGPHRGPGRRRRPPRPQPPHAARQDAKARHRLERFRR